MKAFEGKTFQRLLILLISLTVGIGGCGGGTAGTGLKQFQGTVRTVDGDFLEGVEVVVVETGAAAVTDENGSYFIETSVGAGSVQVDIAREATISSIQIDELPAGDVVIALDVRIDIETNVVTETEVEVTPVESEGSSGGNSGGGATGGSGEEGGVTGEEIFPGGEVGQLPRNTIRGKILSASGVPLAGIRVTDLISGASATTDRDGNFVIEAQAVDGDVTLNVTGDGVNTSVTIEELPSSSASVAVTLEVGSRGDSASTTVTEIREETETEGSGTNEISPGSGGSGESEEESESEVEEGEGMSGIGGGGEGTGGEDGEGEGSGEEEEGEGSGLGSGEGEEEEEEEGEGESGIGEPEGGGGIDGGEGEEDD